MTNNDIVMVAVGVGMIALSVLVNLFIKWADVALLGCRVP